MSIRSTLLACITALACIAVLIAYVHKNTRYEMVSGQEGVYVLDRQTTLMHHCDKQKCKLLSPEGSSIEAMRALSGAPSVNLVRKQQAVACPATCAVPEKKEEKNYTNVNISSFQSVAQPMPSMNELKGNAADVLGMEQVNQQIQKPQNPFPKQNSGAPAPQPKAKPAKKPAPKEESSGYGENDSYGGGEAVESTPEIEALNNPYGKAASSGGSSGGSDPYASGGDSGDSSGGSDSYPSSDDSGGSSGGSDPYASGGDSGDSSGASDPYPS